ncbi:MAG TPA: DUF2461 domain-containing protein, partial [Anaerolineae bacterium]|nr:DUF2461 domain-containing protein [Anaerolineae bacterium]
STTPNLDPGLSFLDDLSQNNNKHWFDQNRPAYAAARSAFEQFVDGVIDAFREVDNLQDLAARECMPRINRDVRFSKDKSPYKTNLGALVAPGGWRATAQGYYISLQPHGQSMAAGGLYDPTPQQLDRFRQAIDRDAAAFRQVTQAPDFVDIFGAVEGARLKTAPKGYDRDHPTIDLLQLKQILVMRRFADQEVLAPDFAGRVVAACWAMRPFLKYLDGALA